MTLELGCVSHDLGDPGADRAYDVCVSARHCRGRTARAYALCTAAIQSASGRLKAPLVV